MAKSTMRQVAFTWPYKGVNKDWPTMAQPALSCPDALNVMTDEPQRGRSRGGSRNGTVKAIATQLGDGTSRRVTGLHQVTKSTIDAGSAGGGGSASGLYDTIANHDEFDEYNDENGYLLENVKPAWSAVAVDDDLGGSNAIVAYMNRLGASGRDILGDGGSDEPFRISADLQGVGTTGLDCRAAAVRPSNYHPTDNFELVADVALYGGTNLYLTCRLDKDDVAGSKGSAITLEAWTVMDGGTFLWEWHLAIYQGTTKLAEGTVPTELGGMLSGGRVGIRVAGNTLTAVVGGQTTSVTASASTVGSRRAIGMGVRGDGSINDRGTGTGVGGCTIYGVMALSLTTANDYSQLDNSDDFSAYATGETLEATSLYDVGTDGDYTYPGYPKSYWPGPLEMLDGVRKKTGTGFEDLGTVGDDGAPFVVLNQASEEYQGCAIFRTDTFTPADNFEARMTFHATGEGNANAGLMVRIKNGDPDDADGVLTLIFGTPGPISFGDPGDFNRQVSSRFSLWRGDEFLGSGGSNLFSSDQDVTACIRVEGERVTCIANGRPIITATVAGQNTGHTGIGVLAVGGGPAFSGEALKLRTVEVYTAPAGGAEVPGEQVRDVRLVVVVGEDVYTGQLGGSFTKIDNVRSTQRKPQLCDLNGLVYLVDGSNDVKKIDPVAATAVNLVANEGGVPAKASICVAWRGRLVLSGDVDNPQNVYMSEAGDPAGWNYSPGTPSAVQAVALNAGESGRIGQPVVALVPWRDDVLVIGCDHGIYQLTGDPAAGGTLDAISEAIGFLTRDAWCLSPDGMIYFVGTGGFYRMAPGGQPENLSLGKWSGFFSNLNRRDNYVLCCWERDRHGCYIFVSPRVDGADHTHLWYDAKQGAFWPIRLPTTQGPLACLTFDGDAPDDRHTLLGGHDGYVRRFDKEADQDDGTPITSYVYIGPINPGGAFDKAKLIEMEVTTGVPTNRLDYAIRVGPDAATALAAADEFGGTFTTAGRQEKIRSRARGNVIVLKLGNAELGKAWTLERVNGVVDDAGRVR